MKPASSSSSSSLLPLTRTSDICNKTPSTMNNCAVFLLTICFYFWVSFAQPSTILLSTNLSTTWTNNSLSPPLQFSDGSIGRLILFKEANALRTFEPGFGCGFLCNLTHDSCLFAIVILDNVQGSVVEKTFPQLVWSANKGNPVKQDASLQLTHDGLVLRDSDGTKVWSTDTSGKLVAGINLTESGNLVLFNSTNGSVWESFDNPTDALLIGQNLRQGQKISSGSSTANSIPGLYFLSLTSTSLSAFVNTDDQPQRYLDFMPVPLPVERSRLIVVTFDSQSLELLYGTSDEATYGWSYDYDISDASTIHYMRVDSDGHWRIYQWKGSGFVWEAIFEFFSDRDGCQYPLVCGNYGVCNDGQCSCPKSLGGVQYFKQMDVQLPNLGCSSIVPLSCERSTDRHELADFGSLFYFSYIDSEASIPGLSDLEGCKKACLINCSCKAAFFMYRESVQNGSCYMMSPIFSMRATPIESFQYNSVAFVKVQNVSLPPTPEPSLKSGRKFSLATIGVGIIITIFLVIILRVLILHKKRKDCKDTEEDDFKQILLNMPTRYTYEDMSIATNNFSEKLGQGGFGSVFKGELVDGTKIAVKRFDNVGQGMKEFMAEVETMGSIHHINLVRLIGFCAEKSNRLLVYEYMNNGSLDKWIFRKHQKPALDWDARYNIILGIAKGLAYLHEECRWRVAHLDIKPQNILLDDCFNAKVSDFGLCKVINRDHSQVITNVRGTPGYIAPEWLKSKVTVKADIYSFGIVVLEIISGRKVFDYSQPESSANLVTLLQNKAKENRLIDIVDKQSDHMLCHDEESIKMIKLGAWCLQDDQTIRPPMSVVVKVLEGTVEVETCIKYSFTNALDPPKEVKVYTSPAPRPSFLSGPR